MPVVRVHGVDVDRVQFPAARPNQTKNALCLSAERFLLANN